MPHAKPEDVTFLVLDVDGCLTDGAVALDHQGMEIKRFNIKDGLGIRVWQDLGFGIAIITGRKSRSLAARARELGVETVIQGAKKKAEALETVLTDAGVDAKQVAAIGDDWNDLPVLERVGYPACPADASTELHDLVAYRCHAEGGRGAVRELIEHLLATKGMMDEAVARYRV
ncbi:MAG: HAD hydrolase family protein [Planctomycetota bacterium]